MEQNHYETFVCYLNLYYYLSEIKYCIHSNLCENGTLSQSLRNLRAVVFNYSKSNCNHLECKEIKSVSTRALAHLFAKLHYNYGIEINRIQVDYHSRLK